MRTLSRLVVLALIAVSCGGGGGDEPDTTAAAPATATTGTTNPLPATTAAATTTTTVPPPAVGVELLVAGPSGLYLVTADGTAQLLVSSPAAFAIDDLDGGVLFQVERFTRDRRSVVYRVRRGASEAVATLVPTREQGLALNGIAFDDGEPYVYYTRTEGSTIDDTTATLRRYSISTRDVTELSTIGGWVSSSFPVSVSDNLIAFNWASESFHGMRFSDLRANPASIAADPDPADGSEFEACIGVCPSLGELSADGSQLVYTEVTDGVAYAVIRLVGNGAEVRRIALDISDDWFVQSFDLSGDHLVVNRRSSGGILDAWVYNLDRVDPLPVAVGLAGEAYVTRSPIEVASPIPAP